MPLLSGSLDFLLCLTCVAIAAWCARVGNDLLFAGFLWIAAAAFVGAMNLGGLTWTNDTHRWLSALATGPGMLLVGLGVWAAMLGPFRAGRWLAPALSIGCAGLIFYLWLAKSPRLGAVTTGMSLLVLVALPVLAIQAYRAVRPGAAAAAASAIGLLLVAGFGVNQLPLADDGPIRHVDVLHIVLIACYALVWIGVRGVTQRRSWG
ncbi:MAG: hypothetical protein K2Y37_16380 [Pirellulales bacterium]|nr:hypothetical protein [Pirellulales bacterium]